MMILNWHKPFGFHGLYTNISALHGLKFYSNQTYSRLLLMSQDFTSTPFLFVLPTITFKEEMVIRLCQIGIMILKKNKYINPTLKAQVYSIEISCHLNCVSLTLFTTLKGLAQTKIH